MKLPLRVLLVEINEDGTAGGSHQCLYDLARSLDPDTFTPVVLFYQHNRFVARLAAAGVRTLVWERERARERPARGRFRRLQQIVGLGTAIWRRIRLLRSEDIDVVHLNNGPGVGFDDWLPAAKLLRIPILAHARLQFDMPRRIWHALVRRFDAVIAISREIERFLESHAFPRPRTVQIYDGIDAVALQATIDRPPAAVRSELGVPAESVLVSMVGHLRPWKGQDVVLEAVALLPPSVRHRVKVVFVGGVGRGDEAYAASLRRQIARLDLDETVSLLGERTDAAAIMQASDIVLHASTSPEPFGLVVVEGMALGRAVIAAGLGGPAEIVTPESGVLFDPSRPSALAAALEALVADPERRRRLGEGGRRRAREFALRANVASIQAVYLRLVAGRSPQEEPAGVAPRAAR